ncbi:hypothetical protein [Nocardioides alcanivorans]|uniref:hypothetical protein n=1 Tax=Nocardioides alcanivorans TaxID=2897352 RepID=UPI001F38CD98|nr:hypothetical protein [Nocardioides alcanivorans]
MAYSQLRTVQYSGSTSWTIEALTGLSNIRDGSDDLAGGLVIGSDPSWLTNSRLLFTNSGPVKIHDWGSDAAPSTWFDADDIFELDDWTYVDLSDPMLSPNGQRLTFLAQGLASSRSLR